MNTYIKGLACLVLGGGLSFVGCNDDWDKHYENNGSVPKENLMALIQSESRLGKFYEILQKTQTDTLLKSSQTYTVWAPVDEALEKVDMTDLENLQRLVSNHIARYSNPTSAESGKNIFMLNGKAMAFTDAGHFNGVELEEGNRLAVNGILHLLDDTIPYQYNILEYLATHEDYSHVYKFISSFNQKVYSEQLSTAYDSVYVDYNPLLEHMLYGIGEIGSEDSVYTMIIPNNQAWTQAIEKYAPLYIPSSGTAEYKDSVSKAQAGQLLLWGATFGGRVDSPTDRDSLVTITGCVLPKDELGSYFADYKKVRASNGLMYCAENKMNSYMMAFTRIEVEGEKVEGRSSVTRGTLTNRDVEVGSPVTGVSGDSYLEVSNVSTNGGVKIEIPRTLSGYYDVYVDFVPPTVQGLVQKTRVAFQLDYKGGNFKFDDSANNLQGRDPEELIIGNESLEETGIISVKAFENVKLPVANFYDPMWLIDEKNANEEQKVTTFMTIKTDVSGKEYPDVYVRRFLVDRIRFVPIYSEE